MTVCPIAIAVGCQKCPAFKICPAKSILGDQPKAGEKQPEKKRSEEHTSELQSRSDIVCRLLLEKKKNSYR